MDVAEHAWSWVTGAHSSAFIAVVISIGLATVASLIFRRFLSVFARRTQTDLDDVLVRILRIPVSTTVALVGLWYATTLLDLPPPAPYFSQGLFTTMGALIWGFAGSRMITESLNWLLQNREKYNSIITKRTEPVFEVAGKAFVYGGTVYFLFLAWDVDLTGWLASAGVVGIAVGFASQDTLSNLVAGVFILTDGPYKLGDFLILETGERGRVTEISMRVTRLLTNDEVEIIVPNRMMGNSRIVNASGGPHENMRIKAQLRAAYGCDVDQVRQVLLEAARGTVGIVDEPAPQVRLAAFGEWSLDFEVLVWVERPVQAERVADDLNTRLYKALTTAGVPFPLPQRDLHLVTPPKSWPGTPSP